MDFTELCTRLLDRLRRLPESGAITESALARRLGMSQSHLHNTLKGIRGLTVPMADQILENMHWRVWDLIDDLEVKEESARRKIPKSKGRQLSVRPLSHPESVGVPVCHLQYPVPKVLLAGLTEPALLSVEPITDTGGMAEIGDILLADLSCAPDRSFLPDAVYLFLLEGTSAPPLAAAAAAAASAGGTAPASASAPASTATPSLSRYALRWARKGARCTYLLKSDEWTRPERWERTQNATLIGRIHAIAKRPTGMFLRPAPPSDAS
jgi:transcriptional regulator with XRE-family HTH domain